MIELLGILPGALLIIAGLILGAIFGSFLSAAIYRLPRRIDLIRGRSMCPRCSQQIPNRYNIPVVGWLWLRGRCASCQAPIGLRYPLLELGWALAGALSAWTWGLILTYAIVLICVGLAAILSLLTRDLSKTQGEDSARVADQDVGSGS